MLIGQFTPVSAVPLPATLPLFATDLGASGLLGWRRSLHRPLPLLRSLI